MNAPFKPGPVYHTDFEQGSTHWLAARCGLLTCSELDRILTPTLKIAANDKSRAHIWEMAAQRVTQYVEPQYVSDAMLRGQEDEILARDAYSKHYAKVEQCGFVTNGKWGFTIGGSPDGLVGDDGLIEVKSRGQKYQIQTICEHVWNGKCETIPNEYVLQVQGLLLVTERKWCDFISYCGGLPMAVLRVFPDQAIQDAIVNAAHLAEKQIESAVSEYRLALDTYAPRLTPTERTVEEEMVI